MSSKPSLRVALPWLHEAIAEARAADALPAMPALSWLEGRGQTTDVATLDWRRWLLEAVDPAAAASLSRWPAGACLAAAASTEPSAAPGWAVAQPVHLAAGMDHVRLAPLADALPSAAEAAALAESLGRHFAGDVFTLADFIDGAWLVRCVPAIDCTTHDPAGVVGRNIHDFLPSGPDGALVRSVMNEIQMLLHEHPLNERRTATRALPVNGLWLWGFGRYNQAAEPLPPHASGWRLYADDLWLRAFWRIHGGTAGALGDAGTVAEGNALIVMTQPPTTDAAEALSEADSSLFARLSRAVQSGALQSMELFDGARVHALDARSRWRVWRRPARPGAL